MGRLCHNYRFGPLVRFLPPTGSTTLFQALLMQHPSHQARYVFSSTAWIEWRRLFPPSVFLKEDDVLQLRNSPR